MVFQFCLPEDGLSKALSLTKHDQLYPQSVYMGRRAVFFFLYPISSHKNYLGIYLSLMLTIYPTHHLTFHLT